MEPYDEQKAMDEAWKFLRRNTTATLRFGEHLQDVSYVLCHDGGMVIPVMVAMLQPQDMVMYVPEYAEDCMEMHVSLEQFSEEGEGGACVDRWQMYHGEPPDVQWAKVVIDAARFHEMFVDGEGLQRANELAKDETVLCKEANSDSANLTRVCAKVSNVEVASPTMVGIDPLGIDIRARFGIVRLEPEVPFVGKEQVARFISGDA